MLAKVLACSSSMLVISAPSITAVAPESLSIFVFYKFLRGLGIISEIPCLGGMVLQEVAKRGFNNSSGIEGFYWNDLFFFVCWKESEAFE